MKNNLSIVFLLFAAMLFASEQKNPWKISFSGNSYFKTYQLENEIEMPEEFANMDTVKQNFIMMLTKDELTSIYFSYGFFNAKIKLDVTKNTTEKDSSTRIFTFSIAEGERYTFDSLQIHLTDSSNVISINHKKLNNIFGKKYEQILISDKLQEISTHIQEQGFLHASVSYIERLDTLKQTVQVDVYINPKNQVKMGNFISHTTRANDKNNIAGLSDTAWLNNLWRIPKGEILNGKQSASFKNKLFSTQLFSQVKMEDSRREDGLSDMHLYVQERIPGEMRYGIFYEQVYGFGANTYTKHKNFFGKFNEFGFGALIAQHKQEFSLNYANPLLFGTAIQFIPTAIRFENTISFNHEKITPPAYPDSLEERFEVINRANTTFGFSKNIRFRGTLDARFVQKNEDHLVKLKMEAALTFDFTDDRFNPKKGIRIMPTFGVGTNFTGNLVDLELEGNPYSYGEVTTNLYFPIFKTLYGAFSGSYGRFFNETIEDDARIFYQGGSRTVRGYRFRSIYASYTSTDENGKEIINTGLTPNYIRLNEELRWNIPITSLKKWQLVQFFDYAFISDDNSVYKEESDASLGLGIRYHWQFLTFRFDYAFKTNFKNMNPESFAFKRIAFDLSQAF